MVRLIEGWQADYATWQKRHLQDEEIVCVWADGISCNVRLDEDRPCLLVIVGARKDGTKVLRALADGERESEQSWRGVLLDRKQRGLESPPKLDVGDGALGFWAALEQVWPSCRPQRCWVHKTVNVLDKLPKGLQPEAKERLHAIWMAATKPAAARPHSRCCSNSAANAKKAGAGSTAMNKSPS